MLNLIFIVLDHRNNGSRVDMSLYSAENKQIHCITHFPCQILSFFSPEILGAKGDADYSPIRLIEDRLR
jgi:hypothetical protein